MSGRVSQLREKGDTIVEVLIAIAVLSLILAGAYVSSNHSLNNTRQAQERGEALKFVEGQTERLKSLANDTSGVFTNTNAFCIDNSNNPQTATNGPTYGINGLPALASDSFNYIGACSVGTGGRYHLAITRTTSNSTYVFTVHARWDRAGSGDRDEIAMDYKISP